MMRTGLQLIRDLTGRGRADLAAHVVRQIDATLEAAVLIEGVVGAIVPLDEAAITMRSAEHRGDRARADLVEALATAFSTPIDREDLFRLSRSTDNVLDNLRDFLREVRLFAPEKLTPCVPLMQPIHDGLTHLRDGVVSMGADGAAVEPSTLATRKAATAIRRAYEEALAELFTVTLSQETLKHREFLRRIDVVGLRLSEAADALADGWLKRGR